MLPSTLETILLCRCLPEGFLHYHPARLCPPHRNSSPHKSVAALFRSSWHSRSQRHPASGWSGIHRHDRAHWIGSLHRLSAKAWRQSRHNRLDCSRQSSSLCCLSCPDHGFQNNLLLFTHVDYQSVWSKSQLFSSFAWMEIVELLAATCAPR